MGMERGTSFEDLPPRITKPVRLIDAYSEESEKYPGEVGPREVPLAPPRRIFSSVYFNLRT